ncbi:MAG: hypothetical protein ABFS56_17605 [Pseudomonadota bacterium]
MSNFPLLNRWQSIYVEEITFGDFVGENCVSQQEPNFALFSDSHMETGYLATKAHDFISYEYAKFLKGYISQMHAF